MQMLCLGFEPTAAGRWVQTIPRSYGPCMFGQQPVVKLTLVHSHDDVIGSKYESSFLYWTLYMGRPISILIPMVDPNLISRYQSSISSLGRMQVPTQDLDVGLPTSDQYLLPKTTTKPTRIRQTLPGNKKYCLK